MNKLSNYVDRANRELCGHCHKRMGLHSMTHNCPEVTTNGQAKLVFTEQEFRPTGRYQEEEI